MRRSSSIRPMCACPSPRPKRKRSRGARWLIAPLLALYLLTSCAISDPAGSPETADGFKCVLPACVAEILDKGLRPVDCQAGFETLPEATREAIKALPGLGEGFFEQACDGAALRAYDANTAGLVACLERVRIQMRACVD